MGWIGDSGSSSTYRTSYVIGLYQEHRLLLRRMQLAAETPQIRLAMTILPSRTRAPILTAEG
jgi:hypothetical protein